MELALREIGSVAHELGVAPSTLRTWERRYRLVVPARGSAGQRLYTADQVASLRRLLTLIRAGTRAGAAHRTEAVSPGSRSARLQLEATPEASRLARRAVDDLLADRGIDDRRLFFVRLVAAELVNNAVVHGAREAIDFEITLFPEAAELRVRNRGDRLRLKNLRARRRDTGGRGFEVIDALADSWAIETGAAGTTVTVRLATHPDAPIEIDGAVIRPEDYGAQLDA